MKHWIWLSAFALTVTAAPALSQQETSKHPNVETSKSQNGVTPSSVQPTPTLPQEAQAPRETVATAVDYSDLDAFHAVREGNRLLIGGNPGAALGAYDHAGSLVPNAREIEFGRGLAHYRLGEFDQARDAFHEVAGVESDSLADDALYSLGTCDHIEGLQNLDNPQLALSLFENAMRRYHDVLGRRPDHAAARDANLKAASMWREIKRQLQEQQQQESESCDNPQDKEQDENQEQKEGEQQQKDKDEQEQNQQQSQPQDEDEQQDEQQQQSESSDQPEEQQQQQQAQQDEEQQVSREQAERQLREMMQEHRERKKLRREPVERAPVKPVDKDW